MSKAILFGVSYSDFWKLNPKKLLIYQKIFEEKTQAENQFMNLTAWTHGLYVQNAVASVLSKSARYPKKPHEMFGSQKKKTAQEEGMDFERYVMQYNAEHRNKNIER